MFWTAFSTDTLQDTSEQLTLQKEVHKSLVLKSCKENPEGGMGGSCLYLVVYIALSEQSVNSCLEAAFLSGPHRMPVPRILN